MEILIYLVIPCLGSIFLIGGMFYAAYRMSGQESMFWQSGMIRKRVQKVMPDRKGTRRQEDMAERKCDPDQKGTPRQGDMAEREDMPRQKGIPRRALGIILVYMVVCLAFSLLGNTWVNLFFLFLFPLAAWRAYGTPKIYCLYYLILSVAVWLTDVAAVITLQTLMAQGILYLNTPQLQYILMVAVARIAEFMMILLVALVAGRKAGRHITARQVVVSVLLPLYSIFNMYCMLYMVQIFPTKEMLLMLGVNLVLLIGLNIYFCVLVDVMSENHRLENERNLYRTQAKMQHQYYEQEEEKYEASRKLIHDIRNHIQAMEALYSGEHAGEDAPGAASGGACGDANGETSDNAPYIAKGENNGDVSGNAHSAKKYAGEIHRMLNSFQHKYYTSEKLLNIILNDKAKMMQRLDVREDMKVGELSLDFMKETDVTALFANLLDNAVAAAAKSQKGFVRLRVNRVRQFLSVTVENSCDEKPVRTAGVFRSHLAGHEGLGLKIIRQTVEQYGGDVQMDWKDGVFTARVMLVIPSILDLQGT